MNVPCHTHFFIFFFFVWVLYLFLVSHPLVSGVPWVFPILFGLHTRPAATPGYFLHFSASIPFFPLRPGYFLPFLASIAFLPLRPGYFPHFSASIPFFPAASWVFPALSGFSYPRNTEILCMSFSYNTQDSIGKRFPQPFL